MKIKFLSAGVLRELTWLVTTLWLALFLGWLVGDIWLALIFYFCFYVARQILSMRKFELWLKGDGSVHYPPTSGLWAEVGHLVSRKQRSLEKHADIQLYKSEQFKAAAMALDDAIISVGEKRQVEWFNQSAEQKLKLSHADIGMKLEYHLRISEFIQYLHDENYEQPLILKSLQGIPRTFSVEVSNYYKQHKLIIFKDIHELYNSAQIRKDFIANASHELRTPLTVIRGYVETMIDMEANEGRWQMPLEQMHQQSLRMQSLLNELLSLSALESEALVGKPEKINVSELLASLTLSSEQLSSGQHQFNFDIEESLFVEGFKTPLVSVFTNLISNAVRYSPNGGNIAIRLYLKKGMVNFEVQDWGMGIAQEHLARLTERFYRIDDARSRDTGGTGLGLAIVKHILERHGTSLNVSSQYGVGSVFSCQLTAA